MPLGKTAPSAQLYRWQPVTLLSHPPARRYRHPCFAVEYTVSSRSGDRTKVPACPDIAGKFRALPGHAPVSQTHHLSQDATNRVSIINRVSICQYADGNSKRVQRNSLVNTGDSLWTMANGQRRWQTIIHSTTHFIRCSNTKSRRNISIDNLYSPYNGSKRRKVT